LPSFGGVMLFDGMSVLNFENKKNRIEERTKVDRYCVFFKKVCETEAFFFFQKKLKKHSKLCN
jgi:hypothetical protein